MQATASSLGTRPSPRKCSDECQLSPTYKGRPPPTPSSLSWPPLVFVSIPLPARLSIEPQSSTCVHVRVAFSAAHMSCRTSKLQPHKRFTGVLAILNPVLRLSSQTKAQSSDERGIFPKPTLPLVHCSLPGLPLSVFLSLACVALCSQREQHQRPC